MANNRRKDNPLYSATDEVAREGISNLSKEFSGDYSLNQDGHDLTFYMKRVGNVIRCRCTGSVGLTGSGGVNYANVISDADLRFEISTDVNFIEGLGGQVAEIVVKPNGDVFIQCGKAITASGGGTTMNFALNKI